MFLGLYLGFLDSPTERENVELWFDFISRVSRTLIFLFSNRALKY